jgi:hypothetical protein
MPVLEPVEGMALDIQIYCDCMARIRDRINVVQTIMSGGIRIGLPDQTAELIFVQFRKTLEEIAFATLSANKEKYSEVRSDFAKHWRAKDMLAVLDTVNPNFYPVPLPAPVEPSPGHKSFGEPLADGFVTREDFVFLYNCSSEGLHTRNPYREGDQTIKIKYTVQEWVARFQKLLSWHKTELLNGDRWVVNIPCGGPVRAWAASPRQDSAP